jgi:hypothetical protein
MATCTPPRIGTDGSCGGTATLTVDQNADSVCDYFARLYREVVLQHCKPHNVLTLVDFICRVLEDLIGNWLVDFARTRRMSASSISCDAVTEETPSDRRRQRSDCY